MVTDCHKRREPETNGLSLRTANEFLVKSQVESGVSTGRRTVKSRWCMLQRFNILDHFMKCGANGERRDLRSRTREQGAS